MEGEPGAGRDSLALLQALLGVDGSDAVDVVAGKKGPVVVCAFSGV